MDTFDSAFLVIVIALVAWFVVPQLRYLIRRTRGSKWPIATAIIQAGFVGLVPEDTRAASFQYQFTANDKLYSGRFLVIVNEERATKLLKEIDGQSVLVRYNPHRPDISFLTDCYDSRLGGEVATQNPYWLGQFEEIPGSVMNLFRK
jgi:hypothetical protein